MTKLPVMLAFAAIAACAFGATHAESNDVRRSEMVRYGDLDLGNQAGAVTLFRRLHNAAVDVCTGTVREKGGDVADRHCVDHALECRGGASRPADADDLRPRRAA